MNIKVLANKILCMGYTTYMYVYIKRNTCVTGSSPFSWLKKFLALKYKVL